jgi:FkbM family methyltransferase
MKLLKTKYRNLLFYYLENDRYIGQRVALGKYEPYETELILKQTKKGDVVVDAGANIGYYTILLADKVGKKGKVYAFEPDLTSFEILEKNIKANKLKNVVAVNVAVGAKNERRTLYKSEENLGDHKVFKTHSPCGHPLLREGELVKIVGLDEFLKNRKVDLMKIDTQGWEPEVVEGAKKLIEKYKPIIFMEYSPTSYKVAKLDGNKMMNFLQNIYKKIFWIDEWLYIYKVLNKRKIDQICNTNKTGYADLLMKKNISFRDYINGFKDLKIKKWIKKTLFSL